MNTIAPVAITASDIDRLVDAELDEPAPYRADRAWTAIPTAGTWPAFLKPSRGVRRRRQWPATLQPPTWHRRHAPASLDPPPTPGDRGDGRRRFGAGFVARGTGPSERFAGLTSSPWHPVPSPAPHRPSRSGGAAPPASGAGVRPQPDGTTRLSRRGRAQGDRTALGDGRRVAVPVDTVSYRYVGQRIH